jgi:hypothetical protein
VRLNQEGSWQPLKHIEDAVRSAAEHPALKVNCKELFHGDYEGWLTHTHGPHCADFGKVTPAALAAVEQLAPISVSEVADIVKAGQELYATPVHVAPLDVKVNVARLFTDDQEKVINESMAPLEMKGAKAKPKSDAPAKNKRQCQGPCAEFKGAMSFRNDDGSFNVACHACRRVAAGKSISSPQVVTRLHVPDGNVNFSATTIKMPGGTTIDLSQRDQMCDVCKRNVDTAKEPYIGGICIDCTTPELQRSARQMFRNDQAKHAARIADDDDGAIDCSPGG